MIISKREDVLSLYKEAAQKGWVLPCICSENQTTTEAILQAAQDFGKTKGIKNVPVIIAITCNYDHRTQAKYYTSTRNTDVGLKLFTDDIKALAGEGGPYEDVRVMIHLDHIQFDNDKSIYEDDLSVYSSIMYDASALPFDENIKSTAEFVKKRGHELLVEGACDEIVDATGTQRNDLTTPENAKKYLEQTSCDLIVANLGTEHRATGKELKYYTDLAKEIKKAIGEKIVLHGTSSVTNDQVTGLFADGVCKVNIWTALERDASPDLFADMVRHACETAGPDAVKKLVDEGYLTPKCLTGKKASISYFTTTYRQEIMFNRIREMVTEYLQMWYI